MDRLWHPNYWVAGETTFLEPSDFTATAMVSRMNQPQNLHNKITERIVLESSGLPLNHQLCLPWPKHEWFEGVIDHLDWPNVGISTLLNVQNRHGRTPLVKAIPINQMRTEWFQHLAGLEREVTQFKTLMGKPGVGFEDDDFIRFYPNLVSSPNYLGVTVMCETHQFDYDSKQKFPFTVEIGACYPRYIHSGRFPFLSAQVDLHGQWRLLKPETSYEHMISKVEVFVRKYAIQIYNLAKSVQADVVSLDMEYVAPDWLVVFDFDHFPLSTTGKFLTQIQ